MRNKLAALITAGLIAFLTLPASAAAAAAAECEFILGFTTLKALIDAAEGPEKVGECLENQRFNPENGDALQQTTGGLLVWRKADNWTAFTDGYRTWINGPYGLQSRRNVHQFYWETPLDCARVLPERRILRLQGTDHIWVQGPAHRSAGGAGGHPCNHAWDYHWVGDTRALSEVVQSGAELDWDNIEDVSLEYLLSLPSHARWRGDTNIGAPWLSTGLLKEGDLVYLVKWDTDWSQPQLLLIQSAEDLVLFGVRERNYDEFVFGKSEWEQRFGISVAGLQRDVLASVVSAASQPEATMPTPTPIPTSTPEPSPASDRDRAALVAFYNATGGANWRDNRYWLSDAPLDRWHGIQTDKDGRVIRLHLSHNNNLTGPLPATLGTITNLRDLHLSDNHLTGPLPHSLTGLMGLDVFWFEDTGLCAPANDAFRAWVQRIDHVSGKWGCPATASLQRGTLPAATTSDQAALVALYNATGGANWRDNRNWLSDAPLNLWYGVRTDDNGRITSLGLSNNNLTGLLPAEIGNLTNLESLYLSGNSLTGPLPHSITALTRLRGVSLHDTGVCVPANRAFQVWLAHLNRGDIVLRITDGRRICPAA